MSLSNIWIKICANTSLEDAELAAEAGADAVGFVFAPSPRRVTLTQAAAIIPHLPPTLEKIGVFVDASFTEIASTVEADAARQISAIVQDPNIDAILVDSRTATAPGGTGQTFDWTLAANTLFQKVKQRKLIAAGGLTPENVAQAIATLHPWGFDVVSGVEATPGRKDPQKLRAFIANARAAVRS